MSEITFSVREPKTEDEYREAVDTVIDAIKRLQDQTKSDQGDIDRLSQEARLLQAQTAKINGRIEARLKMLDAMVPA